MRRRDALLNDAVLVTREYASEERSLSAGLRSRTGVERHLRSLVLIRGSEPLERPPRFDGSFPSRSRHAVFVAEEKAR